MLSAKDRRTGIEALDFRFEHTWDQQTRASDNDDGDFRFRMSLTGVD
jgi:hypothetical protein